MGSKPHDVLVVSVFVLHSVVLRPYQVTVADVLNSVLYHTLPLLPVVARGLKLLLFNVYDAKVSNSFESTKYYTKKMYIIWYF